MPDWVNKFLDVLSQFTGGRGDAADHIVAYTIAGFFWAALLSISIAQQRKVPQPRERLLRWGFAIALARELFMMGIGVCGALDLVDERTLHMIFPPLEHALSSISLVIVAAGFMRFLVPESRMSSRYWRTGVALNTALYLATFWWWAYFIFRNPESNFDAVWCNWLFHFNAATLNAVAAIWLARNSRGFIRNVICTALVLLFIRDFLKFPDMALNGTYASVFDPVAQALYLIAIPMFGFVYVQELVSRRAEAELKAADLTANLEARVFERTRELEKANEWRTRAESAEQERTRQALKLQHILFELAKADKSDLKTAFRTLLRTVSGTLKVGRVSFWTASPSIDSITCRFLYSDATGSFEAQRLILRAETFPAYFRALQKLTQIVADDARTHDDTREFAESYLVPLGITSLMDIPVWLQGNLAGILCCEHIGRVRKWSQPELDFATAVSDMLALALESADRKRAEDALDLEQRRQAAIVELEAAINREDELQGVLDRIATTVTTLMPATAASVLLWDAASETFTLSSSTVPGQPTQAGAQRVRRTGGASRAIVDTQAPVITPDISNDPYGANSLLDQFGMHAYAGVPLLADGKAHGVLYAIDREVREYTPQEVAFLTATASCAATALIKFRLFESLKETNVRLAAEVAERRRAEEKITASLREKESLLQEVHHRVKNNLQIVSSLLNLQSRDHTDPAIRTAFAESQQRIRSMALIHEMLYQTENPAEIDFGAYLRTLVPALIRSYGAEPVRVSLDITASAIPVRTETAVPLGLIVNELITNSIKHAFPGQRVGCVSIEFRSLKKNTLSLEVRDNGVGLASDFSMENTNTLGLRLVGMMAGQLSAQLEVQSRGGSIFTLTFEVPEASPPPAVHEL